MSSPEQRKTVNIRLYLYAIERLRTNKQKNKPVRHYIYASKDEISVALQYINEGKSHHDLYEYIKKLPYLSAKSDKQLISRAAYIIHRIRMRKK